MSFIQKTFLILILAYLFRGTEESLYGDSPYVDELHPQDLYEMVRDQTEGLCIVQFYNTSAPNSDDFVSNYSIAAKSMIGYARSTAINIEDRLFTNLVMQISTTPTYVFYGYYKHMPETLTTLATVDDLHEETSKHLVRLFEERSVYRLIYNKDNMEMGTADLDFHMMKSKIPWLVVYYKRDHPKTPEIAEVWKELVGIFHERVQFGSCNNPLYDALQIADEEYPVVKFFAKGNKKGNAPEDYTGELTVENLSAYLDEKIMTTSMRPHRIIDSFVVEPCLKKKFCIFVFLPTSIEYQRNCLNVLSVECRKNGRLAWAWFWNQYNEQPDIEDAFDVSELSGPYGTVVVINVQAAMFMKIVLEEEMNGYILEHIVEGIKEDAGFIYNITANTVTVKSIKADVTRDEL